MNAKQLIATVALFAATGAVFAQSTEYPDPAAGFVSTRSRAEVVAEVRQAAVEGVVAQRDGQDSVIPADSRSRAEIRAESVRSAKTPHLPADVTDTYFGA